MYDTIQDRFSFTNLSASLIALTLIGASAHAQSWWVEDPMQTARTRFAVAAAKHNTSNYGIFAFGGTNGGATTYDTVEMFNPLDGLWNSLGTMPATLSGMTAATGDSVDGERIYLIGGSAGSYGTQTCWEYDPIDDQWDNAMPLLPIALTHAAATTATNGKIYVFGGYDDFPAYYSNKVFIFDPMAMSWSSAAPNMPNRRRDHAVVTGCDGLIYVMGGYNSGGVVMSLDVFDPDANTWLPLNPITSTAWTDIPGPRGFEVSAATGRDGLIYMVGGDGYPVENGDLDSYNRWTNTWTAETSQITKRNSQCAIGVGNMVYSIGGIKKYGGVQASTEAWGGLPNLPDCGGIVHVNPPGWQYCAAAPNSISQGGAIISGDGFQSVAMADVVLSASPVPATPGLFFYGPNQIQVPFGDGFRCVGGSIQRLDVAIGQGGVLRSTLDFSSVGGVPSDFQAGHTWFFQAWYRDPQGGPAGFNLSDAYGIYFLP